MKYCIKCIATDTIPGREFKDDGVCFACTYAIQSNENIDWASRENQFREIVQWAKKHNHGGYDCAIGVSGGKDSTFQALYAKEEQGLNALLVRLEPDAITEAGKHNIENLVNHGFDLVSWRNNPVVMRKLTKRAFYEYGNPIKPSEYPLYAVTFKTALSLRIPLVILGENPGLTLGTTKGVGKDDNAFNVSENNTLQGGKSSDWIGDGIERKDLLLYQFPDREELRKSGMRAIYLQYYVREWSAKHNADFSVRHGLMGREEIPGRLCRFSCVDSDLQVLNPLLKYLKFGSANYTEGLNVMIREGKMTREKAIEAASKLDGYCPENYIARFCDYIDVTVDEFWRVMEAKWINKKLFYKDAGGKWKRRFTVGVDFDENFAEE